MFHLFPNTAFVNSLYEGQSSVNHLNFTTASRLSMSPGRGKGSPTWQMIKISMQLRV